MNILLIDDHKLLSTGLKNSIEDIDESMNVYILNDFRSNDIYDEILKLKEIIDIYLIDINLSKISSYDGFELAEKIIKRNPACKIIMLTGYDNLYFEIKAEEIGAKAFVKKDISIEELVNIIRLVYEVSYISEYESKESPLSEREIEIVNLYSKGYTREELASKLYISKRTLGNHLHNIYEKLEVSNAQEMVSKATQLGYIKDNIF